MIHFTRIIFGVVVFVLPVPIFSQHLPEGDYHANRERSIDIVHYKAELCFDFNEQKIQGTAAVQFHPLSPAREVSFDACRLQVEKVNLHTSQTSVPLKFSNNRESIEVELGNLYSARDTLLITIDYSAQPNAGMYFQKDSNRAGQYFVHTYGEGGLHANWLPIYNDTNDKFTTEMVVTVPPPYVVISNGTLLEVKDAPNGEKTFHWRQARPHSNYLISIYAGEFEKGELAPAFGTIPLSYWVPRERLIEGAYAFRNTTKMVEFFSSRFNYRYPWEKYDQIAVPDYAIGAMEHTSVTGHQISVLRTEAAPLDFGPPDFTRYHNFWTAEGTISHELAHHWFGDNLTCRNLSYIWLNESFASYLQMLWDEESLGKEQLQMDRQIALDRYLEYVKNEHVIRPLEYHYFEKPNDMYNEEHTYLKGAIALHLLRNILGDDDFFRGLSYYLHKHEFSNVVSSDLKTAFEEATGSSLDWFFDDWVYGAGHPIFEVSYQYLENRKLVALTIKQIQPFVEGQDEFTLPVDITISTSKGARQHTVWCEQQEEHYFLEAEEKPLMVSVDGSGALVAEIRFEKEPDELLYQITHDDLPGRIWALRQLAQRFPAHPKTLRAISNIISGNEYWGMQAEAAQLLGTLRTPSAEQTLGQALKSPDYRVRKAAVLALPEFGTPSAEETLRNIIRSDAHSDVVATALVALAKANPDVEADFIRQQLGRPAWYDEITIAALDAFKFLGRKALTKDIQPFTNERYNQAVRTAALEAWKSCVPEDPNLHQVLMAHVEGAPYAIQQKALEMLGDLYVADAQPILEKIISESGDQNLQVLAEKALEKISRLEKFSGENKNWAR